MPELAHACQDQNSSRTRFRARDGSPDSVIYTLDSNFSLFSSASASVDRCSFASDAHDRDTIASEISLHLAADEVMTDHHERRAVPNKNPDPNKLTPAPHKSKQHTDIRLSRKAEKAKAKAAVQNKDYNIHNDSIVTTVEYDNSQFSDSARSSFSLALKGESEDRRYRSGVVSKKLDRRRTASLDLNHVVPASSPWSGNAKKPSLSIRRSGNFPSPGTPNYLDAIAGMSKGWSSERVPLRSSSNRRQLNINGCVSTRQFNNGRTLPSKWEDAERWIFSPVSRDGTANSCSLPPPQRRPKSKSGPLGLPGVAHYSLYSPLVPVFDMGNIGNYVFRSPFSAGVIVADSLNKRPNAHALAFPVRNEGCMIRSVSVRGYSEMLPQSSSPSQDVKIEGLKDVSTNISLAVSRRDMATQMSPEGSNHSSPHESASFSDYTLSALPIVEVQSIHSSKSEVRDVPVDERVTVTRCSKKYKARMEVTNDRRKKAVDARPWDVSEAANSILKAKREEARIGAWENLQKAKAEAEIRKLEMKLEKKRSSSLDKIMKKLRSAQQQAQEMRSSALANQTHRVSTSHNATSFRRTRQMGLLSSCFTCHAL